jgi:diguanylate cyclase (GGDEF)-like protein
MRVLKSGCLPSEDSSEASAGTPRAITTRIDLSAIDLESSLPSLPAAALEVVRVCSDPEGDIRQLAEVLGRDPMLAGHVLRVANSAANFRGSEVTSLQRAAMVLGMRALKVVALGFTLANELPHSGVAAGLELRVYWHRSSLNAVIARSLARSVDSSLGEEAFLCGLLSDLGKLVLTHAIPDEYGPVVDASAGWPPAELEREHLGFVASEAAERMLRSWDVPEVLVHGACYADRSEQLPAGATEEARRLVVIVGLARLGTAIMFDPDPSVSIGRFAVEGQRRFGFSAADIDGLVAGLEEEAREATGSLTIDLPAGVSYEVLLEQARSLMVSLSVDAMLQLDETSKQLAVLEREMETLQTQARADGLTGLPNRAMLDLFLMQQAHQRLREELPGHLGVILIELDRLDRVNELLGHDGGDAVLRSFIDALSHAARHSDMLGRFGGGEFCLVVPNATPEMLADAGERLRAAVEAHAVDLGSAGSWKVTASFGCACLPEVTAPGDVVKLIAAAGAELYHAKQAGGNSVAVAPLPVVSR